MDCIPLENSFGGAIGVEQIRLDLNTVVNLVDNELPKIYGSQQEFLIG